MTYDLPKWALESVARGEAIFCWENWNGPSYCSAPAGVGPERHYWSGGGLGKACYDRIQSDRKALAKLVVGQSSEVIRSWHPRHGAKYTVVTRVA